ncbi:MAG: hypothetical protein AAF694_11380 [Bacteroidota bacterium]
MKKLMKSFFWMPVALFLILLACKDPAVEEFQPPSLQNSDRTTNVLAMRSAVNEDSTNQEDDRDEDGDGDIDEELDFCFEFVFPIEINLPGDGIKEANSDEEIDALLEEWFEKYPESEDFPNLKFPLDISRPDGSIVTITSEEELEALFYECFEEYELECDEDDWGYGDDEWGEEWDDEEWIDEEWEDLSCIEFVFPITVSLPNGNTTVANDDDELEDIFEDWFEEVFEGIEAGDTTAIELQFPTFVFPIEVIVEDSARVTVNSEEELIELEFGCYGDFFDPCFEMIFPVTIVLPDGTSVVANSQAECDQVFLDWFEANPESEEFPEIGFPFDVKLADDTVVTIDDEEEFDALFDDCFGEWDDINGSSFFTGGSRTAATRAVIQNR